jgi:hypothetical protein
MKQYNFTGSKVSMDIDALKAEIAALKVSLKEKEGILYRAEQ